MSENEENFFDKFMDDIIIEEERRKRVDSDEDTAARKLVKMYRELPNNRIRIGGL
jgi:hypothetical protein